jgi:hypothetical protein
VDGEKPPVGATACYCYGSAAGQTQLIAAGLTMQLFLFGMRSARYAYTSKLCPTAIGATGTGLASDGTNWVVSGVLHCRHRTSACGSR